LIDPGILDADEIEVIEGSPCRAGKCPGVIPNDFLLGRIGANRTK